jgi:RNA-binding protein
MTSPTSLGPTSNKKRSLMPSTKLRRALRGHGHHLTPIVQVGKAGASEAVLKQVEQALADHELVKVRVDADSPDDRFAAADGLAALPGVNVVQILGRAILLYKRHPQKPRYEGKRAAAAAAAKSGGGEAEPTSQAKRSKGKRPTGKRATGKRATGKR